MEYLPANFALGAGTTNRKDYEFMREEILGQLKAALPVDGAYVTAAFSGYGLMAACAAGELLAAHITGAALPAYAPAFLLSRYADPTYQAQLAAWGSTGQL